MKYMRRSPGWKSKVGASLPAEFTCAGHIEHRLRSLPESCVQTDAAPCLRSAHSARAGAAAVALLALSAGSVEVSAQEDPVVQGLSLQHFLPSGGATNYVHLLGTDTAGHLSPHFGLQLSYGHEPLRVRSSVDGSVSSVVGALAQTDVSVGLGLLERLELGLALPIVVYQAGDYDTTEQFSNLPAQGIGDLRLNGKLNVLRSDQGINLAIGVQSQLPSGDHTVLTGNRTATLEPWVAAELRLGKHLRFMTNVGYVLRGQQQLFGLEVGNELRYGLGTQLALLPDKLAILGEIFGRAPGTPPEEFSVSMVPVEALVSARVRVGDRQMVNLSGGTGLTEGYGTPMFRVGVGYSYILGMKPMAKDSDGDGLIDREDRCPNQAEDVDGFQDGDGCPEADNDGDKLADTQDKCPNEAEDLDGFHDNDGCPEPDNDGDGLLDTLDQCPSDPESMNSIDDDDGCPEADTDKDGLVDPVDKCPGEAETVNGIEDADGCPEPDDDGDGVLNALDKCPKKPETRNGFKDEDGCPELDTDGDGLIDALDRCPKVPETSNGFKDDDGCPERDSDKDGIVDEKDKCPRKAETVNSFQDDDGCPDTPPAAAPAEGTEKAVEPTSTPETVAPAVQKPPIKLGDVKWLIFFPTGETNLDARNREQLEKAAAWLKENPTVAVQLLAFSDDSGDVARNQTVARSFGEAVQKFLTEQGIDAGRLTVKILAEKWPRKPNTSEENRAGNRRVRVLPIGKDGKGVEKLPVDTDVAIPAGL